MFLFRRPDDAFIDRYLSARAGEDFCYDGVGSTVVGPKRLQPAIGYVVDHSRTRLGSGKSCFDLAKSALQDWKSVRLGWVEPFPAATRIEPGAVIAIVACTHGIWSINPGRIVYTVDERSEPCDRFGFAYGTLPGHAAAGEERFLVEWDRLSGEVFYDVCAFSRPHHWLARVAYPYLRHRQRRFARDSAAMMQSSVLSGEP